MRFTPLFALLLAFFLTDWTHGSGWLPNIVYNIRDVGIGGLTACTGGTDDTAFLNFQSAAQTYQAGHPGAANIELDIPSGVTCNISGASFSGRFTFGIKSLHVVGLGTQPTIASSALILGGGEAFITADANHFARISTVASGATSITLTEAGTGCAPSCAALFNAGDWVLIAGLNIQADGGGFPPNAAFWDWMQVDHVSSETVFFTTALTNGYKSTWPLYVAPPGGTQHTESFGPGTIYALDQNWNAVQEFVNINFSIPGFQSICKARDCTFRNVTFTNSSGGGCIVPTENVWWRLIDSVATAGTGCGLEIDKLIDNVLVQNTTIKGFDFQQASVKNFTIAGSTMTATVSGSPINMTISNSSINHFLPGANKQGFSRSNTLISTSITTFDQGGFLIPNINLMGSWSGGTYTVPNPVLITSATNDGGLAKFTVASSDSHTSTNPTDGYTTGMVMRFITGAHCSSFVDDWYLITVFPPNQIEAQGSAFTNTTCIGTIESQSWAWSVPGGNIMFSGVKTNQGPVLQVNDVTQDTTNTYVTFNQNGSPYAGAFPTMPLSSTALGSVAGLQTHPSPIFTCTSCSGADNLTDTNGATPGAPLWSYANRVVTSSNGSPNPAGRPLTWGLMDHINITPTVAAGAGITFVQEQFANANIQILGSASLATYDPSIDATITNLRTLNPTSHSTLYGTDSVTDPGAGAWITGSTLTPQYSSSPGSAQTTIEIFTNQGVVPPP